MEKEGEEKEMRRQEGEKESSKLVDGEILKCGHNFPQQQNWVCTRIDTKACCKY